MHKIYKEFGLDFEQIQSCSRNKHIVNMQLSKIINVFVVLCTFVVAALAAVYPVENVAEASDYRLKRDHHQGVTGPVHTFVKTDKHANFKWGVKHHVGHQYAGRR